MEALVIKEPYVAGCISRDKPEAPAPGEVLLNVCTVGLCGSDLATYRGTNPLVTYPRIPGHEIGAIVENVGSDVPDALTPGMYVTVNPYTNCGSCVPCRSGRPNCCRHNQTMGVQRDGALTPFIAVPWQKVIAGEGLSPRELALVEPISVGFHAVDRARIRKEDTVVVLGCGMIGLGAVAGASFRGARVVAVDVDDRKLSVAAGAGASAGVNIKKERLHACIEELTNGNGPEVIIEAIGLPETFIAAVEEVAFAGRVVYIGYAKAAVTYDASLFVKKEIDVLGSRNAMPADFDAVTRMLQEDRFPVESVITETFSLQRASDALRAWDARPQAFTKIHVNVA